MKIENYLRNFLLVHNIVVLHAINIHQSCFTKKQTFESSKNVLVHRHSSLMNLMFFNPYSQGLPLEHA